ncbi:tenascin-R isoform X2 [Betta splendens]|uniref:Tenascin-R isoform X2 n=1 Tax=Betta splendens TaxID=158456 RepID=A0A6P7NUC9_BETSP|nr:tenascin-R isoform X2 [Betta splendens]
MLAFIPSLVLLLAVPSLLNAASSQELQVGGGSTSREAALDSVTVVISEACATQGDSSDVSQAGKEISLAAGSPLVLTHKIKLVPWPGSSSAACGCEADLAALRQRLERLEREVSALREKCGGADGGCCTSKESKGAGCSIHSEDECPNHCSDQGRCEDGRCVCFPGYGGPDCSRTDCPGDCSHRGSCVSGQCVCDPTFTGPDCSQSRCPHDCSRRGSCVDGRCVCSSGFTGPSCADRACAGSCHSRGRCVDGRCVCDEGFTGADCSTRTCPNNCSGRGTCVGGQCVCSAGSTGPDCSTRTCPSNCSNRGRCVKGRCVCRRGFAGPDCSRCDEGKTGPDCDTVMAGVSQLSTRDISETSATLVWTPPAVQYDSYHITFTSQKESDQQVTALVDGGLSSFTQAGLAAGQQYTVIVSGEVGGRRGAQSSAHFMTLIPSPTNLQVVKTTTTSAVVQWEKPQGEIDQYRLTVAPRDGAGKDQVMSVPADRNSAHVLQLDAGRVYDIVLVAEKGRSRSEPVRAQVVPGILSRLSAAALSIQVTLAPGPNIGSAEQEFSWSTDPPGREDVADPSHVGGPGGSTDPSTSLIGRTKPLVSKAMAGGGSKLRLPDRNTLFKKPNVPGRFNATRFVANGKRFGSGPLMKPLAGGRLRPHIAPDKPKAPVEDKTGHLTESDLSAGTSRPERTENPAVMSGPNTERPGQQHHSTSGSTGTLAQEKRCLNKMKVTHSRLAPKDRGSSCREDGTVVENTGPGSSGLDASSTHRESDADYLPDPSHRLLTDTFDSLNITSFSVHLVKLSSLSVKAETAKKQIIGGLKSQPSVAPSSAPPSINSVNASSWNTVRSDSDGPSEGSTTAYLTHGTLLPSGDREVRRNQAAPKRGRNQLLKFGTFQIRSPVNRTRQPLGFNVFPKQETETRQSSANEFALFPSSSGSVDRNAAVNASRDGVTKPVSSVVDQGQKNKPETRRQVPLRRLPPKRAFMRRPLPNTGPHNQSRPSVKLLARPSRPGPKAGTQTQPASSTELPAISPPASEASYLPAEPVRQREADGATSTTNTANTLNQTVSLHRTPLSKHPTPRAGLHHDLQRHGRPSTNRTHLNLSQHSNGGYKTPSAKVNELPVNFELPSIPLGNHSIPIVPGFVQGANVRRLVDDRHSTIQHHTTQPTHHKTSNWDHSDTGNAGQNRPIIQQSSSGSRTAFPNKESPARGLTAQQHRQLKNYVSGSHSTQGQDARPGLGPGASSAGMGREPLLYVGVRNRTSDGFTLVWDSPQGKYTNFIVTTKEAVKDKAPKLQDGKKVQQGASQDAGQQPRGAGDGAGPDQNASTLKGERSTAAQEGTLTNVLPGSSRLLQVQDLFPQTDYTITLLGKGPGLLSRLHKLVISTGPEPPSDIVFSEVTENSLTVSWTKPKSPVNGFRVTYSHSEDADPLSVSVDSQDSTLKLSQLSPGSSYEVSVVSLLGLDESDPIKEAVSTLPDPPTDLQAVNVTDAKALLLWRPALAAVDQYSIVYGSGAGSEVRISVSGNSAEQQLSGLEASTTYTVTVSSRQGGVEGPAASSSFTTASGPADEDAPRDLQANNVTPRAARLSWKPPSKLIGSYRMTYGTEGQEMKEVTVEASMTQHHLTRLRPGAKYTVQLQAERGGQLLPTTSTEFTTGRLRFPFPSDCSQELLNGIRRSGATEIFPRGKLVAPVTVYCDMETDGGGWTVFQRRKDGSVNFFRGWKDYVKGFGDLNGEFWLGLDNLHNLTAMSRMSLRVDLRDRNESAFATYATFAVAQKNYRLTVGGYSGTAGDSLSYHSNRIFSTRDRDPLQSITRCATSYRGGWWYRNCHEANLNGLYGVNVKHQGVIWTSWRGKEFSIPFTEMKMRPAAFRG